MKTLSLLTAALVLMISNSAHALIEVRGMAGFGIIQSNSLNQALNDAGITGVAAIGIGGIDAILRLPGTNLGLGLRNDWQGIKVSATGGSGNEFEVSVKRYAAVLSYRFIDKLGYVGLIGTYGITHNPWVYLKQSGTVINCDSGQTSSATGAFEAGLNLGFLTFGVETGLQSYLVRDLKGSSGQANFDLNFGSSYILAVLGVRL